MSLVHQLHAFHTNALYLVVIAYSAVGSILARLRQTFIMVRFTVDTNEASRTGTPVPIDYTLCVLKVQYKSTCLPVSQTSSSSNCLRRISCGHLCATQQRNLNHLTAKNGASTNLKAEKWFLWPEGGQVICELRGAVE